MYLYVSLISFVNVTSLSQSSPCAGQGCPNNHRSCQLEETQSIPVVAASGADTWLVLRGSDGQQSAAFPNIATFIADRIQRRQSLTVTLCNSVSSHHVTTRLPCVVDAEGQWNSNVLDMVDLCWHYWFVEGHGQGAPKHSDALVKDECDRHQ